MDKKDNKSVSQERILEELAAIGFAKATDIIKVENGKLALKNTRQRAAIASIEGNEKGLKVKFYDKLKALELMGRQMGMFDGSAKGSAPKNNLLEAIVAATGEEVGADEIPELQQAAADRHDLVEPPESEGA